MEISNRFAVSYWGLSLAVPHSPSSLFFFLMCTHSKWLPYSPLSLKTCNCSTINDIKHFGWIHEFQSASFSVQHSPKDTDPDSHAQAFCPQHSQREVVIDTSKIKTLPRRFSIHVCVCVWIADVFSLGLLDVLRVWVFQLKCEFMCMYA